MTARIGRRGVHQRNSSIFRGFKKAIKAGVLEALRTPRDGGYMCVYIGFWASWISRRFHPGVCDRTYGYFKFGNVFAPSLSLCYYCNTAACIHYKLLIPWYVTVTSKIIVIYFWAYGCLLVRSNICKVGVGILFYFITLRLTPAYCAVI